LERGREGWTETYDASLGDDSGCCHGGLGKLRWGWSGDLDGQIVLVGEWDSGFHVVVTVASLDLVAGRWAIVSVDLRAGSVIIRRRIAFVVFRSRVVMIVDRGSRFGFNVFIVVVAEFEIGMLIVLVIGLPIRLLRLRFRLG
tara:strand:+ start:2257 stop:2682 length:426 start_codon:yes stop_codon:yes gene_type:complete